MKSEQQKFEKAVKDLKLRLGVVEDRDEVKKMLNYFLCYPDVDDAMQHHLANNIGTNDLLAVQEQIKEQVQKKVSQGLLRTSPTWMPVPAAESWLTTGGSPTAPI